MFQKVIGGLGMELTSMKKKRGSWVADEILYLCGGANFSSGLALAYANSGRASGRVLEAPSRQP